MTNKLVKGLWAFCLMAGTATTALSADNNVGVLNCTVEGGIGLIIGSRKAMTCKFDPANGSGSQSYTGHVGKLGLDIGITGKSYIAWGVIASGQLEPGSLAGDYVGASGQATVGVGVGANALVGGSKKQITLQPLSVEGQTGLNVALGIGRMELKFVE